MALTALRMNSSSSLGVSVAPVANHSIYTSTTQGFALSASVLANIVCLAESESERAHLLLRALLCVAAFVFLSFFFFFPRTHSYIRSAG